MAAPIHVTLTVCEASREAAVASFRSLEAHLPDFVGELSGFGLEGAGVDLSDLIAVRANDFTISFEPTDRCRLLFSAVAARYVDLGVIEVEGCHGWPILSSVGCSTTMAEGAAESIRSPGSAEAA